MAEILLVSKHRLRNDPNQPRRCIKPEAIEKKKHQLKEDGQVTPLLVWPADEHGVHLIVDGETRWRGALLLDDDEFDLFKVEVYQGSREDAAKLLLTQLLRNDDGSEPLTPLERAVAYRQLVAQFQDDEEKGSAMKQAADKLGMDYSGFTRAIKLADMSPAVADFVLERGIDDKRVINGIMRVEQRGTRQRLDELFQDIEENEAKKQARETATSTREIVSLAVKELKDPKARKVAKEKTKRKLEARSFELKFKDGADQIIIETPREIITFKISPEVAEKFKKLDMIEVETGTETFKL